MVIRPYHSCWVGVRSGNTGQGSEHSLAMLSVVGNSEWVWWVLLQHFQEALWTVGQMGKFHVHDEVCDVVSWPVGLVAKLSQVLGAE